MTLFGQLLTIDALIPLLFGPLQQSPPVGLAGPTPGPQENRIGAVLAEHGEDGLVVRPDREDLAVALGVVRDHDCQIIDPKERGGRPEFLPEPPPESDFAETTGAVVPQGVALPAQRHWAKPVHRWICRTVQPVSAHNSRATNGLAINAIGST